MFKNISSTPEIICTWTYLTKLRSTLSSSRYTCDSKTDWRAIKRELKERDRHHCYQKKLSLFFVWSVVSRKVLWCTSVQVSHWTVTTWKWWPGLSGQGPTAPWCPARHTPGPWFLPLVNSHALGTLDHAITVLHSLKTWWTHNLTSLSNGQTNRELLALMKITNTISWVSAMYQALYANSYLILTDKL